MSLPGRLETQRALVLDYRAHVARFGEIADYLERWQPPALMLWGRHDVFFVLEETVSWMKVLPRMEAHIFDGPHFLLETQAAECAALRPADGIPEPLVIEHRLPDRQGLAPIDSPWRAVRARRVQPIHRR